MILAQDFRGSQSVMTGKVKFVKILAVATAGLTPNIVQWRGKKTPDTQIPLDRSLIHNSENVWQRKTGTIGGYNFRNPSPTPAFAI